MGKSDWVGLVVFLVLCFGVAALGSLATTPQIGGWYQMLRKPSWTPPNWLFGPVWTLLYGMMAVAAWLVWKRQGWSGARGALLLFGVQLVLNLAWSFIFFAAHRTGAAFAEIALLWVAILATIIAFAAHSKLAAWLLIPYLLWVSYAAALNFSIWKLND